MLLYIVLIVILSMGLLRGILNYNKRQGIVIELNFGFVMYQMIVSSIIYFYGIDLLLEFLAIYGIINILLVLQWSNLTYRLGVTQEGLLKGKFEDYKFEIILLTITMLISILVPIYFLIVLIFGVSLIQGTINVLEISFGNATLLVLMYIVSQILIAVINDTTKNTFIKITESKGQ